MSPTLLTVQTVFSCFRLVLGRAILTQPVSNGPILEPLFAEEGLCRVSRLLSIAGAWEHVPAGSWTH
jgi:hypothetical protein